jgi:glutamine synthetase
MSIFLGDELEAIFTALARGEDAVGPQPERLGLGTPVLPPLARHSADRNRTSPFAFTGNKFEFRALGSSQSAGLATTILNTITAEAIHDLRRSVEAWMAAGDSVDRAVREVVADAYRRHGRVVFGGDGYSDAWTAEAERRGLLNLRTTPDALPQLVADSTVRVFEERSVLSARELNARYEVLVEQYATQLAIEAEITAQMARTLLLPAALRQRELAAAGPLAEPMLAELDGPLADLHAAIRELEAVSAPEHGLARAEAMRDRAIPAMAAVRAAADRLERLVARDLWPLPTYAEMLFRR